MKSKLNYNDLHNTYSPKHHKPTQPKMDRTINRPSYMTLWKNQMRNNKYLLFANGILSFLALGILLGCSVRVEQLKQELGAKETARLYAVEQADLLTTDYNNLLVEYASCSAKLDESKLSSKAKAHMKQQPEVAEGIKRVFGTDWIAATELYSRESSLDITSVNKSSGACGLWQAYPCEKLVKKCTLTDLDCQLQTGKEYIESRYGTATEALAFHDLKGWY